MPTLLDGAAHYGRWMVEFRFGATPTILRLTDQESDVTFLGQTWTSEPSLEILPSPNTSDLDESPFSFVVQRDVHALFQSISSGEPSPRVEVLVYEEIDLPDLSGPSEKFHHFRGYLSRATRNYQGRRDVLKIDCLSIKSQMVSPLGLPANSQCVWTFRDQNCQVIGAAQENASITDIDGNVVTLTGPYSTSPDRRWEMGYMILDGLSIGIRIWRSAEPSKFHLRNRPPASWDGQAVVIVPGCRKTIEACREWNNEEHFGGFGFAIPSFQPNYETPST